MLNKLDELKISIQYTNPSIILITESWLNDKVPDSLISITGYNLHRKDREHCEEEECVSMLRTI
mgnify:CR=1 FL=1